MTTDSRFVTGTGGHRRDQKRVRMDKDCRGRLASFLEGGDVIRPPGAESSLGICVFLFTHRSVVGEGLRVRRGHPWWRERERGQAGK